MTAPIRPHPTTPGTHLIQRLYRRESDRAVPSGADVLVRHHELPLHGQGHPDGVAGHLRGPVGRLVDHRDPEFGRLVEVDGVHPDASAGNHLHTRPERVDPGLVEQLGGDHDRIGVGRRPADLLRSTEVFEADERRRFEMGLDGLGVVERAGLDDHYRCPSRHWRLYPLVVVNN